MDCVQLESKVAMGEALQRYLVAGDYTYRAISLDLSALVTQNKWRVWRIHTASGHITLPMKAADTGKGDASFNYPCNDMANLNYFDPAP